MTAIRRLGAAGRRLRLLPFLTLRVFRLLLDTPEYFMVAGVALPAGKKRPNRDERET